MGRVANDEDDEIAPVEPRRTANVAVNLLQDPVLAGAISIRDEGALARVVEEPAVQQLVLAQTARSPGRSS